MSIEALEPFSDTVWQRIRTQDKLQFYEGPVRSGKTLASLISLAGYIMTRDVEQGVMSGNTQASVIRNCVKAKPGLLDILPNAKLVERDGSKQIIVPKEGKEVVIYLFGADKADSEDSLRGLSIDFWYADEITKHHMNFIKEALARSAASDHPFMLWTSNPENPYNPIYTEYTDKFRDFDKETNRRFGGYHEFHFRLEDNPIMTPKKIEALKLNYSGVEYKRKILGERCVAEGLVYPEVDESYFRPIEQGEVDVRYCAIDFGTDHPTTMVFGGFVKNNKKDWRIVAEYYDEKSNKTPYDYYIDYLDMCSKLGVDPMRMTVAIDPAAKVLRLEFIRHGLAVVKAKNDVWDGINYTRNVIYKRILTFNSIDRLRHLFKEFSTYSWDPTASERGEDKPNKKAGHDDMMDALRYFAYTFMKPIIGT